MADTLKADGRGPDPRDMALGLRIREWRKAAGITQAALAETVGMTFQQIQKYERAFTRVSFSRLVQIAQALGANVAELIAGLDDAVDRAPLSEHRAAHLRLRGAPELLAAYATLTAPQRRVVLDLLAEITREVPGVTVIKTERATAQDDRGRVNSFRSAAPAIGERPLNGPVQ